MSTITTNTTLDSTYLTTASNWPITISAACTVTIGASVSIPGSSNNYYFNIVSPNVTIDGNNKTFTITSATDGLFRNGTSSQSGFNNVTIQNVSVDGSGSSTTLNTGGGWVCQSYFGNGASSNVVQYCNSKGIISGTGSGGILGSYAGYNYGTAFASNCYSTGTLSGPNCGGIFGQSAGFEGNVSANNCYSTGNISGNYAGGIFGAEASAPSGTASVTNCYSQGIISGSGCGGIFGQYAGGFVEVTANNCYFLYGTNIAGPDSSVSSSNIYAPNYPSNTWNNSTASGTLSNSPSTYPGSGSVWTSISTSNTPFVLTATNLATPVISSVSSTTSTSATVTLTAAVLEATSYTATSSPDGFTGTSTDPLSITVSGLTAGVEYTFTVVATNGTTSSSLSSAASDPVTPLAIPTILSASSISSSSATITYLSVVGATTYTTTSSPGALTFTTSSTSATFSTLSTDTEYTFTVVATNSTSTSTSAASNVVVSYSSSFLTTASNWPIVIDTPSSVSLAASVSIPTVAPVSNYYFDIQSPNVTIDGLNNTFTITSATGGLFRNGTSTQNGSSDVTIQNVSVDGSSTTLNVGGGWVCQSYFGNGASNNLVQYCNSKGIISGTGSGGILGSYAGNSGGNVSATNCYSTGTISGEYSGGIIGYYAGYDNGTVSATNCYSTGNISNNSGGIFGALAGYFGYAFAENCYSIGTVSGNSGGIFGANTGDEGTVTATNCYLLNSYLLSGTVTTSSIYYPNGSWSDNTAVSNLTGTPSSFPGTGTTWTSLYSNTPFVLTSNLDPTITNTSVNTNQVTLTGTASYTNSSSSDTIYIYQNSFQSGTATVGSDGMWSWVSSGLNNGNNYQYFATQTINGVEYNSNTTSPVTVSVSDPTIDTITVENFNTISLTGTATYYSSDPTSSNNTISIYQNGSSTPTATATVGSDGMWSWVSSGLENGDYSYSATQTINSVVYTSTSSPQVTVSVSDPTIDTITVDNFNTISLTGTATYYSSDPTSSNNTVAIYLDGSPTTPIATVFIQGDNSWSWTSSVLSAGGYSYYAVQTINSVDYQSSTTTSTHISLVITGTTTLTSQQLTTAVNWPIIISAACTVTIGESVSIPGSSSDYGYYFDIQSTGVTIDGDNQTFTITSATDGLFRNGTSSQSGFNNVTIQNVSVDGSSTTVNYQGGWVCQSYFGNGASNNLVQYCNSIGAISGNESGGILGSYAGNNSGTVSANSCYSKGDISAEDAGGIYGSNAGYSTGNVTATNCYSEGDMSGLYSGGIYGSNAGYSTGNVTATNCYSKGSILGNGNESGGIYGSYAGNNSGTVSATGCYSEGDISAENAGGIYGSYAGYSTGNVTATNCYSKGVISGNYSGGILGSYAGNNSGTVSADNCYSEGVISGNYSGGILGSYAGNNYGTVSADNCYSEGDISGYNSGGIFGANGGNTNQGSVTASNCYSQGTISGIHTGGIFGGYCGAYRGVATATECYSLGNISNYSGGIFGISAGINNGSASVTNCYSRGSVDSNSGGIFAENSGTDSGSVSATNCYFLYGTNISAGGSGSITELYIYAPNYPFNTWSDTDASTALTDDPTSFPGTATVWTSVGSNTPFVLTGTNLATPVISSVSSPTSTSATVTLTAAVSGATSYTATSSPDGFTGTSTDPLSITVSGLTPGTAYTFTVVATNGTTSSSLSSTPSDSVTPLSTPINVSASATSSTTATVTCDAVTGASGYTATSSPGGVTGTSSDPATITVNGLSPGTTYSFTVVATNSTSTSSPSTASNSVMTPPSVNPTINTPSIVNFNTISLTGTATYDSGNPGSSSNTVAIYQNGSLQTPLASIQSDGSWSWISGVLPAGYYSYYAVQTVNSVDYQSSTTSPSTHISLVITGTTTLSSQQLTTADNWPIIITAACTVTIADSVSISGSYYFDIQSSDVTIDGGNNTFTITSATGGLFRNGTDSQSGFNNVTIQNVSVDGSSTTVNDQGGWVCQTYFGSGASGNLVQYCNSTGAISGIESGGILGSQAGSFGGNVSASNCYSTGSISGSQCGGIFGSVAGNDGGNVSATNCYSTGSISGNYSGGIFGYGAGNGGTASATNCYSTGSISGFGGGGIFGYDAGISGTASATNCYSTGSISGSQCGGIFGQYAGSRGGTASASNCYFLYGTNIAGSGTVSQSYIYAPNGTWINSTASGTLLNTPSTYPGSGTVWTSVSTSNTPFVLTGTNLATPVISSVSSTTSTSATVTLSAAVPGATSYTATSSPGSFTGTLVAPTNPSTPIQITVSGLTAGVEYTFTVVATNGTTSSSDSSTPSNPITPLPAPINVHATSSSSTSATVTCNDVVGASGYTATATYTGGSPILVDSQGSTPTMEFTGLTAGTTYTITVVAKNGSDVTSSPSDPVTITPLAIPTDVIASTSSTTPTSATITCSNVDGASTYIATSSPGGKTGTVNDSTSTTITILVPDLTPGTTYTFTVVATNSTSTSSSSLPSNAVTTFLSINPTINTPSIVNFNTISLTGTATYDSGNPGSSSNTVAIYQNGSLQTPLASIQSDGSWSWISGVLPAGYYSYYAVQTVNSVDYQSSTTSPSTHISLVITGTTTLSSQELTTVDNWPIIISAACTVTIGESVSISGSYYFDIQSSDVTVDGNNKTFTITSATDGLFRNGTSSQSGFSNVTIQNVSVDGSSTTLNAGGGWVCQSYFGRGATGNLVQNCNSIGDISGSSSGGIFGRDAASSSGNVTGSNCYSTGVISGSSSGGIFGTTAGSGGGNVSATNCYSTGNILGSDSGGIFGYSCGSFSGNASAANCYSTGTVALNNGGIFASYAGDYNGTVSATNCYFLYGTSIAGTDSTISSSNIYAPNYPSNTWNNSTASGTLSNAPSTYPGSGSVWTSISTSNTPFVLTATNLATPVISSVSSTTSTSATVTLSAAVPEATSYTATSSPDGLTGTSSDPLSITVSGLTAGTAYTFTVVATNGTTSSSLSSTASTPPVAPLAIPTNVSVTSSSSTSATVTCDQVTGASGYRATATYTGGSPITVDSVDINPTMEFTGLLTPGTTYTITVIAYNTSATSSPSSSVTVTPLQTPTITNTTSSSSIPSTTVTVTFNQVPNATNYTATATYTGGSLSIPNASYQGTTFTGLTAGTTYTITVTAYGSDTNTSSTSLPSTITPLAIPTILSASSISSSSATITYSSVVGATTYTTTSSPGALTFTTSSTSATFSTLSTDTEYTFTVVATNSTSTSTSAASNVVVSYSSSFLTTASNWPIVIDTPSSVSLAASVSIPTVAPVSNYYFDIQSPNVTIDGLNNTFTITSATGGLFRNGTSTQNGSSDVTIQNLSVNGSSGGSLNDQGGWICQTYFGRGGSNNLVQYCNSTGTISGLSSGGILGSYAAYSGGNVTADNCYSTGDISGSESGGIFGAFGGNNTQGNVTATNCYSQGTISGPHTGGILGGYCGAYSGLATATECYSLGDISTYSGGIFGISAGLNGGSASVTNCYSRGSVNTNSGGIFAENPGNNFGAASATNCYFLNGTNISAGGSGSITQSYIYAPNGTWNDTDASTALTDDPTSFPGTAMVWTSLASETPFVLTSNLDPYILNPPTLNNTQVNLSGVATYVSDSTVSTNILTIYQNNVAQMVTATILSNGTWTWSSGVLDLGSTYVFYVTQTINGNIFTSNTSDSVTISIEDPTINTPLLNINQVSLSGNATYVPSSILKIYQNGTEQLVPAVLSSDGTWTWSSSGLSNDTYSYQVKQTVNGNVYSSDISPSVTVNVSNPTINSPSIVNFNTISLTGTATYVSSGSSVQIYQNSLPVTGATAIIQQNGTWSWTSGVLDAGSYSYYVVQTVNSVDYQSSTTTSTHISLVITGTTTLTSQQLTTAVNWPIIISAACTVTIGASVSIPGSSSDYGYYFNIQSPNVTIDGDNKTFTITSTTDGLFRNGTDSQSGFNNVTIQNVSVDGSSTTLNISGGWVCQSYFGKGASSNVVQNCNSKGDISGYYSGGIFGDSAGYSGGNLSITNCYSTGNISDNSGGIFGPFAGFNGNVSASNCYSTGNISNFSGGIFGPDTGGNGGNVSVTSCYSTGTVSDDSGGIFGNNSTAMATNCYLLNSYLLRGTITSSFIYYPNGTWINSTASGTLSNAPSTYPGSGTVWTSVSTSNTPFVLTGTNLTTPVISSVSSTTSTSATVTLSAAVPGATSYTATSSPGSFTGTLTAPSNPSTPIQITVNGLTAGTAYTFTVVATNGTTASSLSSTPSDSVTPLSTPANVSVTSSSSTSATVTCDPVTEASGYTATARVAGSEQTIMVDSVGSLPTMQFTGLVPENTYTIRVVAKNGSNVTSSSSNPVTITPLAIPIITSTTSPSSTTATVTFNQVPNATSYSATATYMGGSLSIPNANYQGTTFTGLTAGTTYTITVTAYKTSANLTSSPSSSSTIIPLAIPTILSASATSSSSATVTVSPVSGALSYTATSSPGGLTGISTSPDPTTITVNGLSPGTTYTFTVVATNSTSTSSSSLPSAAVTTPPSVNPMINTPSIVNFNTISLTGTATYDSGNPSSSSNTVAIYQNGSLQTPLVSLQSNGTWSWTSGVLSAGYYSYYAVQTVNNVPYQSSTTSPSTHISLVITGTTTLSSQQLTTAVNWPIIIHPSAACTVTIGDSVSISGSYYFDIQSTDVTIDGNNKTFTITSATDGLFRNGTSTQSGFNNVTIQNVSVDGSSTTLNWFRGWVCQTNFGRAASNNVVQTCNSKGDISYYSGGIFGYGTGSDFGTVLASNCYSTGTISGDYSGGIFGYGAGSGGGTASATNCYSTGSISGSQSGGIFGDSAGSGGGTASATNCYFLYGTNIAGSGTVSQSNIYAPNYPSGSWINSAASGILTGDPTTYPGSGTVWTSVSTSNTPFVLTGTNLATPVISSVSSIASTSATVTLTAAVLGATSYTATSSPDGLTGTLAAPTDPSTPIQITVNGLTAGTTYTFTVVATNGTTASSLSSTPSDPVTPLSTPTNVSASSSSSTTVTVTCDPVAGASGYTATATYTGGFTTANSVDINPTMEFTGLIPATTYSITVVAKGANSTSPSSSPAVPVTTTINAPTNITVTSSSATTASVTFDTVNGAVSYTATATYGPNDSLSITANSQGSVPVIGFTTLTPGTTYSITVVAIGANSTSPSSSPAVIVTPVAAPTNVTVTSSSSTSASVTFDAVSAASGYTATATYSGGSPITANSQGSNTTIDFTTLTAGTTYSITVVTRGTNSTSSPSSPAVTITPLAAPTDIVATVIDSTSVSVSFSSVTGATLYTVTSTDDDSGLSQTFLGSSSPITVSGLSQGTPYTITVVAENASSTSSPSTPVILNNNIPSINSIAVVNLNEVYLTGTASYDTVNSSNNSLLLFIYNQTTQTLTTGTTTISVDNSWSFTTDALTNGNYQFVARRTIDGTNYDSNVVTATISFSSPTMLTSALVNKNRISLTGTATYTYKASFNTLYVLNTVGNVIGTTFVYPNGSWSFTTDGLANGTYLYRVRQTINGLNYDSGLSIPRTVDIQFPVPFSNAYFKIVVKNVLDGFQFLDLVDNKWEERELYTEVERYLKESSLTQYIVLDRIKIYYNDYELSKTSKKTLGNIPDYSYSFPQFVINSPKPV